MKKHVVHTNCDICGRNGARTWGVSTPEGEKARVDLCPKCDDPARKMFVAGRRPNASPQGAEAMDEWVVDNYKPGASEGHVEKQNSPWVAAKEKRG